MSLKFLDARELTYEETSPKPWNYLEHLTVKTFSIRKQPISAANITIKKPEDQKGSVALSISGENVQVKFMPIKVAEAFPSLVAYEVLKCSVESLKAIHFEKMKLLICLSLNRNKISDISDDAFADLVSLQYLDLSFNRLRTLSNVKLFYDKTKLSEVRLGNNTCINKDYSQNVNLDKLKEDLTETCFGGSSGIFFNVVMSMIIVSYILVFIVVCIAKKLAHSIQSVSEK
jgi:Leucine rich repeat